MGGSTFWYYEMGHSCKVVLAGYICLSYAIDFYMRNSDNALMRSTNYHEWCKEVMKKSNNNKRDIATRLISDVAAAITSLDTPLFISHPRARVNTNYFLSYDIVF